MATCPTCHRPATTRDGFDRRGRQRFACRLCHRDFTHASSSAFSGYRWPPEVILTAVRWYLSYPLSARQVTELLAERGIDVSARTVMTWTQTFGPQLATAARRHRRRLGRRWYIDEVFPFRGAVKRYLYRAVDEHGQVVDVLLRERRDLASAQAFFRRARATAETQPAAIVTDHHQPYVRAAKQNLPGSLHIRTAVDHRAFSVPQPHVAPHNFADSSPSGFDSCFGTGGAAQSIARKPLGSDGRGV
jgi:transposase-like protein